MAEYIEREALIQHMQECKDENAFTLMATGYAYSFIEAAPSADVVEVIHGRWERGTGSYTRIKCSICEWCKPYIEDFYEAERMSDIAYCPNCGAKMDGDLDG